MNPLTSLVTTWLESARLAPSAHNTQPWKCSWDQQTLIISNDVAHTLQAGDPTMRQTYLGLGTFLQNLVLAAANDNYSVAIDETTFAAQSGKPAVTLHFIPGNAEHSGLFQAIPLRHTNRGLYQTALPESTLSVLQAIEHPAAVSLDFVTESPAKDRIAKLVEKGIFIGLTMNSLREELADLVSFKNEGRLDGLQVESMTPHPAQAASGHDWLMNSLNPVDEATFNYEKFSSAPVLVIVSTTFDGPGAWIEAGRTLESLLLTAARHGLAHCISAAPVEIPTLAPLLRAETAQKGRPQALVRLGIPRDPSFTVSSPRRPVEEILNRL
jgi:hypothetical protein